MEPAALCYLMKGILVRRFLAGSLSVGFALLLVFAGSTAANAATIPDPLDVTDIAHLDFPTPRNAADYKTTIPGRLIAQAKGPSLRYGAGPTPRGSRSGAGIAGRYRQSAAARALDQDRPKHQTVAEYQASKLANGTPKEKAAMASVRSKFVLPATKLGPLAKLGGGPAGAMISAAGVGIGIGVGASEAFGLNVDESFCSPSYADPLNLTAQVVGVNCDDFYKLRDEYAQNTDAPVGLNPAAIGLKSCLPDGRCATIRGISGVGNQQRFCLTFPTAYSSVPSANYGTSPANWLGGVAYTVGGAGVCPGLGTTGTGSLAGFLNWAGGSNALTAWRASDLVSAANATAVPAPKPANPDRTLKCTIRITGGAQFSATSAQYSEGSGKISPPHCPAVVQGIAEEVKIESISEGLSPHEIYKEGTLPGYRTFKTDTPECESGLCTAELFKLKDGKVIDCFDAGEECLGWFTDPNKTAVYKCEYGGKPTELADCNQYAEVFNIQRQAEGAPYVDPETGVSPGPNTGPAIGVNKPGTQVKDPEKERQCFPTGWAVLNPLEWVLKPVGCALEDAFVPRESVVNARAENIAKKWDKSPPGKIVMAVNTWDFDVSVSGCQGLQFNVDPWFPAQWNFSLGTHAVAPACPGDPLAPVAPWSRIVFNLVVTISAAIAVTYLVSSIVNGRGVGE